MIIVYSAQLHHAISYFLYGNEDRHRESPASVVVLSLVTIFMDICKWS